jgi:hypothetical protein
VIWVVAALIVAYAIYQFFVPGPEPMPIIGFQGGHAKHECQRDCKPDMHIPKTNPAECTSATGTYYTGMPNWPTTADPIVLPTPEQIAAICADTACYSPPEDTSALRTTGLALAPVHCAEGEEDCRYKDVVISNGNDMSEQRIYVFNNDGGTVDPEVAWFSCDADFNSNMVAGDYDHDGDIDIAVGTVFDTDEWLDSGKVKLYRNTGTELERCPFMTLDPKVSGQDGGVVIGVDLGDANGDAKLDLVAAIGGYLKVKGKGNMPQVKKTASVLYYNTGNPAAPFNTGVYTKKNLKVGDAKFGDVNGDGLMDVALAARRATVFFGSDASGTPSIPLKSGASTWTSEPQKRGAYGISLGTKRLSDYLPVAYSPNAETDDGIGNTQNGPQPFYAYLPTDPDAKWTSKSTGSNSRVQLSDVDKSGSDDLIAGRWDPEIASTRGDRVRIFKDVMLSGASDEPDWCSSPNYEPVAQDLGVADLSLDPDGLVHTYPVKDGAAGAGPWITTIPGRVERIVAVVDQEGTPIDSDLYTWVPGRDWVAFAGAAARVGLTIQYQTSATPDLVVNDWSVRTSVSIFTHQ